MDFCSVWVAIDTNNVVVWPPDLATNRQGTISPPEVTFIAPLATGTGGWALSQPDGGGAAA
jgi:hypothetical protein